MVRFEWSDSLSVGNDRIDRQHRNIINEVNGLLDACKDGEGLGKLPETFSFLEIHILEHFRDEEELQRETGFPDIEKHKEDHDRFKETFEGLKKELEENGPSLSLVIKANGIACEWLEEHIYNLDREFGRHIMLNPRPPMKG